MKIAEKAAAYSQKEFTIDDSEFESGNGKGVYLKAMKPFNDFVLNHLVKDDELINGQALLPDGERPVVIITSHGPGLAWVPILALAGRFYDDNGYGEVVGGMYPHKAVFLVPGLKAYYKKILGTPTDVNTVDDLVEIFKKRQITVTGTAPEGANSLLSFDEYVGPFRSKGMIAAAIKADADLCLIAHQGADEWNLRFNLPFGLTIPNTNGLRGFNIALPPYKKLDSYLAVCKRYTPSMTSRDFETLSRRESRLMLHVEIEKIRAQMNLMTDEVKGLMQRKKTLRILNKSRA